MSDIEGDIEQIVLGIEQKVFTAIQRKDVELLGSFLSEDFVHRTSNGSESGKDDFLRSISAMPVEVVSIRGEHQRVDVYGEVAVLTGVQHAEWRQGDDVKGISSVAFTDVFALRDGKWLMALAYSMDLES
ncbi:MAG: nuclear transport factor 2 family protein [Pyrinomonadaceae bacterium]|nr:nuclear transport factor 2 family protein [Pyrinomonadaceae bacterium]